MILTLCEFANKFYSLDFSSSNKQNNARQQNKAKIFDAMIQFTANKFNNLLFAPSLLFAIHLILSADN